MIKGFTEIAKDLSFLFCLDMSQHHHFCSIICDSYLTKFASGCWSVRMITGE